MNQIEHRRRTAFALERLRVLSRSAVEILGFDRHRQYLLGTERRTFQETIFEMCQVPVGVTRRRHTLVHLKHPHPRPWNLCRCQRTQHHPWSMAAADGEQKSAAGFYSFSCE